MKRSSSADAKPQSCTRKSYQRSSSDMQPQRDDIESEINILDSQLAEIIFKFVPLCQWSSCLEYVSKKFRRSVLKAYARVKFIHFKVLFSSKRLRDNWDSTPVRLNNSLKKLLLVCPNLTGIAGFNYFHCFMKDQSTWNILKKFHRLQSISLDSEFKEIKLKHLADFIVCHESLKSLKVYSNVEKDGGSLDIGTLTCIDCRTVFGMEPILLKNLSERLTSLTIGGFLLSFKSTFDAEQAMKMCVNLELLSVGIHNINDYRILFNILPNLCKLINLRVSGFNSCGEVGGNAFDESFSVQLDVIKNQLESVEFHGIKLSNEVQRFLLTKCSNLQSLYVDGFSISADALQKLPSLPCYLKALTFPDTRGQILPLLLPSIVQLSNFTDLTINREFSEEWENICCLVHLRNLRLYGGYVNDSLLEKWNKKNDKMFERLVSLELRSIGVSDVGGCLLAKKAINLQILDLSRTKIGDKTISVIADVAKKLTEANLAFCDPSFDEKAVLRFIKKATCLQKLKIHPILAKRVVQHKDFAPFVDVIKIEVDRYY